jgi:hypothetical protein
MSGVMGSEPRFHDERWSGREDLNPPSLKLRRDRLSDPSVPEPNPNVRISE